MQAQIQSHAFQLQQQCISTSLTSHPKQLIFYASAYKKNSELSYLYSLKYSQQNPRKSQLEAQKIDGKINSIYTFTHNANQIENTQNASNFSMILSVDSPNKNCKMMIGNCISDTKGLAPGINKTQINQLQNFENIHEESSKIHNFISKPNSKSQLFFNTDSNIFEYNLSQKSVASSIRSMQAQTESEQKQKINHMKIDPIHGYLTYTTSDNKIHILDKSLKSLKYQFQLTTSKHSPEPILNIDYNRNKQYYLMSVHASTVKFWDIRKPNMPIKNLLPDQVKHSLFLNASYNYSHDELVITGYDDGTVGLYRMTSVSSVPNKDQQDVLVKLYDEHQDSVYNLSWSEYSPWIFASLAYGASNIVVNLVPNVQKYRILL